MEFEKSASKATMIGLSVSLAVAGLVLSSPAPSNVKERLAQVRAVVAESPALAADDGFNRAPEPLADDGFNRAPEAFDAGFARRSDP